MRLFQRYWDTTTAKQKTSIPVPGCRFLTFAPDGTALAANGQDGVVLLRAKGDFKQKPQPLSGIEDSLAFSPDGKLLAGGGGVSKHHGDIRIWDAGGGKPLLVLQVHTDVVNCIAFSPDGRRLATGSSDGTIKLWEVNKGHLAPIVQEPLLA